MLIYVYLSSDPFLKEVKISSFSSPVEKASIKALIEKEQLYDSWSKWNFGFFSSTTSGRFSRNLTSKVTAFAPLIS